MSSGHHESAAGKANEFVTLSFHFLPIEFGHVHVIEVCRSVTVITPPRSEGSDPIGRVNGVSVAGLRVLGVRVHGRHLIR
jgi:hypothetical protein